MHNEVESKAIYMGQLVDRVVPDSLGSVLSKQRRETVMESLMSAIIAQYCNNWAGRKQCGGGALTWPVGRGGKHKKGQWWNNEGCEIAVGGHWQVVTMSQKRIEE